MGQERNIYIELPDEAKSKIQEDVTDLLEDSINNIKDFSILDSARYFKNEYLKFFKQSKAKEWFLEDCINDLERLLKEKDSKIQELIEIIQRRG